ncbi:MAG TPA: hypothetical protein PKK43_04940 [Spirochaetota bacterium]|nr:hypothetical protein [Spirochaetota bacterium]
MRKILITVSLVMMCVPWMSGSSGKCGERNETDAKTYSLIDVPASGKIIGLAPNANSVIISDDTSRRIESVRLENGNLNGTIWSIDIGKAGKYPFRKRAVWSRDGKYLAFRSNVVHPIELAYFSNFCIYTIEAASGRILEADNGSCEQKPKLPDLRMTYDAAFIPGTDSLLYHRYAITGVELNMAGISGGKTVLFRKVGGDGAFAYAVPLSSTAALVYIEPMLNQNPMTISISSADKTDREIMRHNRGERPIVWEIKASSADGRVILIQERMFEKQSGNMEISTLKIIRLNNDCSEWKIDPVVGNNGMKILDSALSPDGKRVVYLQKANAAKGDGYVILCTVREGPYERTVFEEKSESLYVWTLKKNGEGIIYMSDRAFILHVGDKYRFYRFD